MDGKELGIEHFKGSPVIMAMFYASCPQACPLLIGKLQSIDAKLPADQRQNLRVLLISMDPDRDTPQALADSFAKYNLDAGRWKMARPKAQDVRTLAALLDVRYKQSANGEFSHNSGVTVVDREGHIRLRVEGLASEEARVTELLNQLL
jgi:protein SCO1